MTRCDNCFGIAAYTCADPGVNPVNYCANCLPVWLQARANAGQFPLVESITTTPSESQSETPSEEPAPSKKKKKTAPADENDAPADENN